MDVKSGKRSTELCCPVLKPQMTGEPTFPGLLTEKWSVTQSPMPPPRIILRSEKKENCSSVWFHIYLRTKKETINDIVF